jgi:hypothetical protein
LTFAQAGVIDLEVPVATPNSPLPRVPVPGFNEHGAPAEQGAPAGHGAPAEGSHEPTPTGETGHG